MSLTSIIQVPKGMSYINAMHALWQGARFPEGMRESSRYEHLETMASAKKVNMLFHEKLSIDYKLNFDWVEGRSIETSFRNFPMLDISSYDSQWGRGAAKRALNNYQSIPNRFRLDPCDQYSFQTLIRQPEETSARSNSINILLMFYVVIGLGAALHYTRTKLYL